MSFGVAHMMRNFILPILVSAGVAAAPALAQIQSVDPDAAIDGDLAPGGEVANPPRIEPEPLGGVDGGQPDAQGVESWDANQAGQSGVTSPAGEPAPQEPSTTYHKDDLIGAAEGVFGKGSQGLASMIEDLLKKQGEPNGYIVGREAGGAVAIGLRYGSGTLHHKVEGNRPVYWTGPSLGFDLGANAGKAFVLVYNLYDTQDLFHRYGSGEGQAYLVGGFHVSYLRRGDVVLIPVRMGAGLRLGANVGYMKFSEKQSWLPF